MWADRQRRHGMGEMLVAIVTTTPHTDRAEPEPLVGTYQKLVASSVGEQQCNTVILDEMQAILGQA